MGAVKNVLFEFAVAGHCPLSDDTFDYLDDIESTHNLDWIGYCEHDYTGRDGQSYTHFCISISSARRLAAEGLANVEIENFLEYWGDLAPAC
jgi:hypothetical protein